MRERRVHPLGNFELCLNVCLLDVYSDIYRINVGILGARGKVSEGTKTLGCILWGP